jgi:hypothetical protein
VTVFKELELGLPEGSIIYAEKSYTAYDYEDLLWGPSMRTSYEDILLKEAGLHLKVQRKKNSKRPLLAWEEFLGKPIRHYIETVFSKLTTFSLRRSTRSRRGLRVEDCLVPASLLYPVLVVGV